MKEKLTIIKTLAEVKNLIDYLADKDFVAFDSETDGTNKESRIIGYSVCASLEEAFYVVTHYWDVAQQKLIQIETDKMSKKVMEVLKTKQLIMHNGIFDCWMVENNFGVRLIDSLHTDTMVLGHLLNENRSNALKERALELYGEDSVAEQRAMKESVTKNGGVLNKSTYELFKADADLIAYYGAKDAILTLKLFFHDTEQLYEEGLEDFFYKDESMPLLRSATYDLNTTGLLVDQDKLQKLKAELEADIVEAEALILREIAPLVKDKYPGTKKTNTFNINAPQQLSWLLFIRLGNEFGTLSDTGKKVCKALGLKIPYNAAAKRQFIAEVEQNKGAVWEAESVNPKTHKKVKAKKVKDSWTYLQCGKAILAKLSKKYRWVEKFVEYKKNVKLLSTYVVGIQERMQYGIIRPNFLQIGTTSGRYSSKNPNFQNLPRDDKRVKSTIQSRRGKVFVGADYSQLEPRVFASISQDPTLMGCFAKGEDFYSVVGAPIFGVTGCSMIKDAPNSFAKKHSELRDKSKVISLSTPYGRTASQQATQMGISREEAQDLIDQYFDAYPKVYQMMLESHEIVKKEGQVKNLFGRPRRIPEAKSINKIYGRASHAELPYEARTLLNLAMNHRVQSTGASIMNRAAIQVCKYRDELAKDDPRWKDVKVILQVHDELILEGPEALKDEMVIILKDSMENTVKLPGVDLIAEPKIATNLADLK